MNLRQWIEENEVIIPEIEYSVNGKPHSLSRDEVLSASITRLGSEQALWAILKKIVDANPWRYNFEIKEILRDFSIWKAYEGNMDFSMEEIIPLEWDKRFVAHLMKTYNISEQQMRCDHDSQDQYADDGMFYNSTGRCKKCLLSDNLFIDYIDVKDEILTEWKESEKQRRKTFFDKLKGLK